MRNLLAICTSTVILTLAFATRKGDHVFYDTELISFIDPLKHGFHVILTETAYEHLFANPFQLPAVYLTVIPLNGRHGASRQILYKDAIRDKVVKISSGLQERSWYYVCLEYETFSIGVGLNETTSTKCGIYRTLDKFGKRAEQSLSEVKILKITPTSMHFQLIVDAAYPLTLTLYLQEGSAPAQMIVVDSPNAKVIDAVFRNLEPGTSYGALCALEQPTLRSYTAMSRTVQAQLKSCWFSGNELRTGAPELNASPSAASHRRTDNRMDLAMVNGGEQRNRIHRVLPSLVYAIVSIAVSVIVFW